MKIYLILFCCCFISINAVADIYQSVDKNGVVTFSDQPNASSKSVTLPAANIVTQPVTAKTKNTNATTNAVEEKKPYAAFTIASPKDQDSIFNTTDITLTVQVDPALQPDDKIQFYYDGNPVDEPSTKTSITIPKVRDGKEMLVRGSHTIYATIINKDGEVLSTTPTITIFLHYASVNSPASSKQQ
jgi:Domain of unknown function (DUF4124)